MSSPSRASRLGLLAFFALWLLVLVLPLPRAVWQLQLAGLSRDTQFFGGGSPDKTLLQRFPDDVQLAAAMAQRESYYGSTYKPGASNKDVSLSDATKGYDQVIARYPREAWLYANWLTRVTIFGIVPPTTPDERSLRSSLDFRQLTPQELRRVVQVADQGGQLDPQNSFYDVMRAAAFSGLNQNREALDALKEGAAKPHFDDGTYAMTKAQMHALDLMGYRLWEERVAAVTSEEYHQFAVFRSVSRTASVQALEARQHGDWGGAWRIYDDMQHVGATMCHDSSNYIGVLVGKAVLQGIWRNAVLGEDAFKERESRVVFAPQPKPITAPQFAVFARQRGRADLADFALRTYNSFDAKDAFRATRDKYLFSGVPVSDAQVTMRTNEIGELLLRILLPCVGLWLALGTALWWRGPRAASLSRLDIAASVGFCLPLLLAGLTYTWYWQNKLILQDFFYTGDQDSYAGVKQHIATLRTVMPWGVPILGIVYATLASLWRQRVLRQEVGAEADTYILAPRPRWAAIVLGLAGYLLTVGVLYSFSTSVLNWPNESSSDIGIYTLALLALPLVLLIRWLGGRWQFSAKTALLRWRAVEWYWRTLGAFALLLSMAYAGLLWNSLPARMRADEGLNRYVSMGETRFIRQVAGKSTGNSTPLE